MPTWLLWVELTPFILFGLAALALCSREMGYNSGYAEGRKQGRRSQRHDDYMRSLMNEAETMHSSIVTAEQVTEAIARGAAELKAIQDARIHARKMP